jgi:hypothetical protein
LEKLAEDARKLFDWFLAPERSSNVPPRDGRGSLLYLALCRRRLLDGEPVLGRDASADLIAMAARNSVCMTLRKLCVYINGGIV